MSFQQPPFGPGSAFAAFPSTQIRNPRRVSSHANLDSDRDRERSNSGPTPADTQAQPTHGAWQSTDPTHSSHSATSNPSQPTDPAAPRSFSSILSPSLNSTSAFANGHGHANGDPASANANANAAGISRPFVYSREFLLSLYDDDKATARRPLELAHHDIATRDKPAKPWAITSEWRDGEKELFTTSIHPTSSRTNNRGSSQPNSITTGGTLDLASLSPLPRDRDRERAAPAPRGSIDKDPVTPGPAARRAKATNGTMGILGGVLGGIGSAAPTRATRAASPAAGERKREGSGGAKEIWQGGRWRRGAAEVEIEERPSSFGARRYPTSDAVPLTDEAAASRAEDEVPATWDADDDDPSSPSAPEDKAPTPTSILPTSPDSDGVPEAAEVINAPLSEPDLSHHASSILGSLALDSQDDPIHHLLRQSPSSALPPPPGLSVPPPPSSDWQYRDPSGQVQGPFAPAMMHDWFRQNFFTGDLRVKRVHERDFEHLDHLTARGGDKVTPFLTAPLQPVATAQLPPPSPANGWPASAPGGSFYEQFSTSSPLAQQGYGGSAFGGPAPAVLDPWGAPLPPAQPQVDASLRSFASPAGWNGYGASAAPTYGLHQAQQQSQFPPSPSGDLFRQVQQQQQHVQSPAEQIFGTSRQSHFFDPTQLSTSATQNDWRSLPSQLPLSRPQQPIGHSTWSLLPTHPPTPITAPAQQHQFGGSPLPAFAQAPAAWASAPAPAQAPPTPIAQPQAPIASIAKTTATDRVIREAAEQDLREKQAAALIASAPSPVAAPAPRPVAPTPPTPQVIPTPAPAPPTPAPTPVPVVATPPPAPVRTATPTTPAPWIKDEDVPEKPTLSLRQIQEIEARQTAERKAAASHQRAIANVQAAQRAAAAEAETLPSTSTWAAMAPSSSAQGKPLGKPAPWIGNKAPVAGKTLKEIQEEEERRKKAVAAVATAANAGNAGVTGAQVRGYAASAKTAVVAGPWTTVPAKPSLPPVAAPTARPVVPGGPVRAVSGPAPIRAASSPSGLTPKPVVRAQPPPPLPRPSPAPAAPVYDAETPPPPSGEFMKWCREALKGLAVPSMDDFITMLLSFPLDASADVLEIISDSVYANSSTLDGRRFANEFSSRRRVDVAARYPALVLSSSKKAGTTVGGKPSSMAEALRQQPQAKTTEWNVKVGGGKKGKGGRK